MGRGVVFMKKTIILNLENIKIEGDILDVACENSGIVCSFSEEAKEEMALDKAYDDIESIKDKKYDACTFFFNLNSLWTLNKKEALIDEVSECLKDNGEIYIWDINKNVGELVDSKLRVLLPNGKIDEYNIKNNNIFSSSNYEETKSILEKTFVIEETKVWEDVYFIKGVKI